MDHQKMAALFHEYMQGDDAFYAATFNADNQMSVMRSLPHEEGVRDNEYVEILDYEKAADLGNPLSGNCTEKVTLCHQIWYSGALKSHFLYRV